MIDLQKLAEMVTEDKQKAEYYFKGSIYRGTKKEAVGYLTERLEIALCNMDFSFISMVIEMIDILEENYIIDGE